MLAAALGSFKLGRFLHGFAHYIAVYNIYVAQRMYANYSAVCAETVYAFLQLIKAVEMICEGNI